MPIALLGMSFLNRMEMQRDGGTMTLKNDSRESMPQRDQEIALLRRKSN